MSAHRYWRIYTTATTSRPYTGCAELQLRTTAGGSNVATGGTPLYSTQGFGNASNAFDGNTGTFYSSSNGAMPEYLGYDFGSGNDKDIVEFSWLPRQDSFATTDAPKDFQLQFSDDGTNWFTRFGWFSQTWGSSSAQVFTVPTPSAHRYWKINFSASNGGNIVVIDTELRATSGGSDQTGSGTAGGTGTIVGFTTAGAFDGDCTTAWSAATGNTLTYDFGSGNDKTVTELVLVCGVDVTTAPKDFSLQYSDDNTTWYAPIWVTGATGWAPGKRRTFHSDSTEVSTPSPAAACRYWRLVSTDSNGGGQTHVAEMEMRLSHGGADQTGSGTAIEGSTPLTGGEASKAFDNNSATSWQVGAILAWMGYDFGSGVTKDIVEVAIQATSTTSDAPKNFLIQRSDDFAAWTTTMTLAGITSWSSGQTRYFDASGETSGAAPVTARPVVFVCT